MSKSKKLFLVTILFCTSIALFLMANMSFNKAPATFALAENPVNIQMADGASVRKDDPTGIRFTTKVDKGYLDGLTEKERTSIIYGTEFTTTKETEVLDMTISKTYTDNSGNTLFNSVIWNVPETEYETEVTAKSYFKFGAEGEKNYVANPQTRSMAYVSASALKSGEQDNNGFLKTIVDKALTIPTSVTTKDVIALPLSGVVDYTVNDPDAVIENGNFLPKVVKDYVITAKCGEGYTKELTVSCADFLLVSGEESDPLPVLFIPYEGTKGKIAEVSLTIKQSDLLKSNVPFLCVLDGRDKTKAVIEPSGSDTLNAITTDDIVNWTDIKFNAEIVENSEHKTGIKFRMHFNAEPWHSAKAGQTFMFKNVNIVEDKPDYSLVTPDEDLFIPSQLAIGKSTEVTLKIKAFGLNKKDVPFLAVKDSKNNSNVIIEPSGSDKKGAITTDHIAVWKEIRFNAEIVADGGGKPSIKLHIHYNADPYHSTKDGQTFMFKDVNIVEDMPDYKLVSDASNVPELLIPCKDLSAGSTATITCKVKYFNIQAKDKPFIRVCKDNLPNGEAVTIIEPLNADTTKLRLNDVALWTEITFDAVIVNDGVNNGVKLRMNFNADPWHSTQAGQTLMIKDFVAVAK